MMPHDIAHEVLSFVCRMGEAPAWCAEHPAMVSALREYDGSDDSESGIYGAALDALRDGVEPVTHDAADWRCAGDWP